jgi:hypothetical protein
MFEIPLIIPPPFDGGGCACRQAEVGGKETLIHIHAN